MTGRVIEDDLFGICRRLASIDDGYFVFLDYKTGKFEVHNRRNSPSTLCLVLPYDTLDERTVERVLYTRAERVKQIIARMDSENAKIKEAQTKRAIEKIADEAERARSVGASHTA